MLLRLELSSTIPLVIIGPLLAVGSGKVTGIVSWGEGCAEKNYPGVFTEIAHFKVWMTGVMGFWPVTRHNA
jgi:secreted trypsin-like serine protease